MLQAFYLQILFYEGANATSEFVCTVEAMNIVTWNIKLNVRYGVIQPRLADTQVSLKVTAHGDQNQVSS